MKRLKRPKQQPLYFSEVVIKRYQSYEDVIFKLSPGVNLIVGPTDSGKTAVMRAIQYVAFNDPQDPDFRTGYRDITEIIVRRNDGKGVRRKRNNSNNIYEILDGDKVTERLETVGRGKAPLPVQKILNLADINFQAQHDSPYLISSEFSAGAVARIINRLTKLDDLDKWTSEFRKELNSLNSTKKVIESDLEEDEEKLKKYDGLDEIVGRAEGIIKDWDSLERRESDLEEIIELIDSFENLIAKVRKINEDLKFEEPVVSLLNRWEELDEKERRLKEINDAVHQINEMNGEIEEINGLIEFEPTIIGVLKRFEEFDGRKQRMLDVEKLVSDYDYFQEQIGEVDKKLLFIRGEIEKILLEVKICPTCGNKITEKDIQKHLEELFK